MSYDIKQIEGIGVIYGERLVSHGIHTTTDLLEKAGAKFQRQQLSTATEIPESLILTWVNHADLMRIDGIAGHFSELMEAAGVDTVKELAHRNAEHLHEKMIEVNNQYGLTGKVPSAEHLAQMIGQAKKLDQKVFH
jgi:predicted flap endonuclease-1-like 5' DNA nuclease